MAEADAAEEKRQARLQDESGPQPGTEDNTSYRAEQLAKGRAYMQNALANSGPGLAGCYPATDDGYVRQCALGSAIQYAQGRNQSAQQVVADAEAFMAFLKPRPITPAE